MDHVEDLSEQHWLVLHEVRLRGLAEIPDSDELAHLLEIGAVVRTRQYVTLARGTRDHHATWARLPEGSDEHAAVLAAYEAFLPLNRELIRCCSDWQVRPGGVANDHRDLRYDWKVIERLERIDERVGPIARRLARHAPRFAGYRPRLAAALAHVVDGEPEWFASPRIDSYHTVWMQLHEDLLLALARDRSEEPEP